MFKHEISRRGFLAGTVAASVALGLRPHSYAQARSPLAVSTKGMVTSPHTLASEAGLKVLQQGGNAMEAAIAIGAVIAVTYPHFCGIGGDAIWIVADRTGRKTTFMGIGQAAEKPPEYQGDKIPLRGPLSTVTSACTVDTWRHAHEYSQANWPGFSPVFLPGGSVRRKAINLSSRGWQTA